jgi:acetyltransferase-like isoleucine patch superfamily enzyme
MPPLTPTALIQRIKQRDTPLYDRLYRTARYTRHVNVPCIRAIHLPLYWLHRVLTGAFFHTLRLLYYQPLFTARCDRVGPGLFIERGMPLVEGHLRIRLGQKVRMAGRSTFSAASRSRDPVLEIGDNSYLGYQTAITVGAHVTIGRHVLIANRVFIAGDDGHPIGPEARRSTPGPGTGFVAIEDDVWIGEAAIVLKNVRIGSGAIVAAGAVVAKDVPSRTIVAGNPARVVRRVDEP